MTEGIKSYFNIYNNAASGNDVVIDLFGVVGDWWTDTNTKEQFINKLKTVNADNITLNISSPGGDVWDALAIYDAFKGHPARVTARLSGLVASAASFIALAADEVVASPTTLFMIHNVWGVVMGDKEDLKKEVENMGKHDEVIAQIYKKKTGKRIDTIRNWMKNETWFLAEEALKEGFVDRIEAGLAFEKEVSIEDAQTREFMSNTMNCLHIPEHIYNDNHIEMEFSQEEKGLLKKIANFFNKAEKVDNPTEAPADVQALQTRIGELEDALNEKENESFQNLINGITNALKPQIEEAAKEAVQEIAVATEQATTELKNEVAEIKQNAQDASKASEDAATALNARVDDLAKSANIAKSLAAVPQTSEKNGDGIEKTVAPENTFMSFVKAKTNNN